MRVHVSMQKNALVVFLPDVACDGGGLGGRVTQTYLVYAVYCVNPLHTPIPSAPFSLTHTHKGHFEKLTESQAELITGSHYLENTGPSGAL